jgi:hypothetical protein
MKNSLLNNLDITAGDRFIFEGTVEEYDSGGKQSADRFD